MVLDAVGLGPCGTFREAMSQGFRAVVDFGKDVGLWISYIWLHSKMERCRRDVLAKGLYFHLLRVANFSRQLMRPVNLHDGEQGEDGADGDG